VDYYAPNFRIDVEGREIDQTTKGDILQVKVTMELEALTDFELTVNNWDDQQLFFKYSDTDTFDVGRNVLVQMGYADELLPMVSGMVTTLTPQFPDSGAPTLSVRGADRLFCLKDSKPPEGESLIYTEMADWQIAEIVAQRNGLATELTREGPTRELVMQNKDQDDAQFLIERAGFVDFDVYVKTDVNGQEKLHFCEPTDGRNGRPVNVYRFIWGQNLISFSPTLTLSGQVSELTVRGWDPETKSAIVGTATQDDVPDPGTGGLSGPASIGACLGDVGGRQEFVVDVPVENEEDARQLAISLLRQRAYEFMTGVGSVIGIPDLRPGDNVQLEGLGTRFSGTWYVRKVTHTIGENGYRTQFEVRRTHVPEPEAGGPTP